MFKWYINTCTCIHNYNNPMNKLSKYTYYYTEYNYANIKRSVSRICINYPMSILSSISTNAITSSSCFRPINYINPCVSCLISIKNSNAYDLINEANKVVIFYTWINPVILFVSLLIHKYVFSIIYSTQATLRWNMPFTKKSRYYSRTHHHNNELSGVA